MTVSIIIAVKEWRGNLNLDQCIGECRKLDFADFEILVLVDTSFQGQPIEEPPAVKYIVCKGSPARKRDRALDFAKGEILAFIDDDAYPDRDWLKNAVLNFQDSAVAAVGGPAVTPADDTLRQKASGLIFASPLVSGRFVYRYLAEKKRYLDDYPSCNFLVRKSIMDELGGFDTDFWPGEDTKLCLEITRKLGKKIVYDPAALVYHHRRRLFAGHLRQVASYALHRGYFAKRYPETSRKISYFLPALFLAALASGGILSLFSAVVRAAYLSGVLLYLILVAVFSLSGRPAFAPLLFSGIILTHLAYGLFFLKGLFVKRLKEEE